MRSNEIRKKFLEFFKSKGHAIIPSASLVPVETDPTVLFTTAGMQPLTPYFLGEKHPGGQRVANAQKCARTSDIEEVGDASHLTFFEMLGNWSFGDYFKKEAIEWSWEFLTDKKWLGLDKDRIAASVFAGDPSTNSGQAQPFDEESFEIWKNLGLSEKRIAKLPKKDNWWGPVGRTGPCGPDTEIFYWADKSSPDDFQKTHSDSRWIEIWNDVFMQYGKTQDGGYQRLKQKNVDTGMGLERMAMVMQNKNNVYETDLFQPLVVKIKSKIPASLAGELNLKPNDSEKSVRIVADHIKASVFIISDGVEPSNVGRGYILRRLIRRAVRHGRLLGIKDNFLNNIAEPVFEIYKEVYLELDKNKEKILRVLNNEIEKFGRTLEKGLKEFEKISRGGSVSGRDAFMLFSTYGFPLEMTVEMAKEKDLKVNVKDFDKEFIKHQDLSRTAAAGVFKGGLADAGEQTKKLHTAAHLLHQALRIVLGNHVAQKGSNITAERLRFDFSHPQKMTGNEIKKAEVLVNEKIRENLPVMCEEMNLDEAKKSGAVGVFDNKYGEKVKVYSIDNFSKEICAGPHVKSTGELGRFKIIKEESVSSGIRRIKAVLE